MRQAVNVVVFLATLYVAAKLLVSKAQSHAEHALSESNISDSQHKPSRQDVDLQALFAAGTPFCKTNPVLAHQLSVLKKYQNADNKYQKNQSKSELHKTEIAKYRSLSNTDMRDSQFERYNQAQVDYAVALSAAEDNSRDISAIRQDINLEVLIPTMLEDLSGISKFHELAKPISLDSQLDDLSDQDRLNIVDDYQRLTAEAISQLELHENRLIFTVKLLRALLAIKTTADPMRNMQSYHATLDANLTRLSSLIDIQNSDELGKNLQQARSLVEAIRFEDASPKKTSVSNKPTKKSQRTDYLKDLYHKILRPSKKSPTPTQSVRAAYGDLQQHFDELIKYADSCRSIPDYAEIDGLNYLLDQVTPIQLSLLTQVSENKTSSSRSRSPTANAYTAISEYGDLFSDDPTGEYSVAMIQSICRSSSSTPVLDPIVLVSPDSDNALRSGASVDSELNLLTRYENEVENPIHVIHHRSGHFVAAAIYRDDQNTPHIIVHDPLGKPQATVDRLVDLLGRSPQPIIHQNGVNDIPGRGDLQQDGINCGPISIEVISHLDKKTCAQIANKQKTVSSISVDLANGPLYTGRSGQWSQVSVDAANLLRAQQFRSVAAHCQSLSHDLSAIQTAFGAPRP